MKNRIILLSILLATPLLIWAQTPKKLVSKEKAPTQKELEKLLENEMKGMGEEEKMEMKKMMKAVMPGLMEGSKTMAVYPDFTSNKQLVPKKNPAEIAAIPKRKMAQADIAGYVTTPFQ